MYEVSDAFVAAVKKSHTIATLAEVWSGGVNPTLLQTLNITEGSIAIEDQPVRRQANVTLVDPNGDLTPADATDLLAPYGNELKLYRGISYGVSYELVPQGVFRIADFRCYDSGQGMTIIVDGYDRARTVQRAALTTEYVVTAGTNYASAIQNLIQSRVSWISFNFATTGLTTPQLVFSAGDDPWQRAQEMAASIGCVLYFDINGICTLQSIASPDEGESVWAYAEGEEAMVLYIVKSLTDKDAYSHVVRVGESSSNSTPYKGEAYDDDPSSPTYYLGQFGDVVDYASSQYITSQTQADAAATAQLNKVRGATEDISFNAVVNPAHELFDIITITREKSHIDAVYMIDRMTIPMTHTRPLEISTRRRTLV